MTALDIWEVEDGYVIPADEYAIEDPDLTDEERSALLVAAQAVQFAGQTTGLSAIFKLGGASPVLNAPNVAADLGHGLDTLSVIFEAIASRRVVMFTYRDKPRKAFPYALAHRFGHWYLAAPETANVDVVKAFRVDRMSDVTIGEDADRFTVPADFDAGAVIPSAGTDTATDEIGVVRFTRDVGSVAARQIPGTVEHPVDDEFVDLHVPIRHDASFVGWVLGFDDAAVILEPARLRARLLDHIGVSA
jgi:predicted DNA-binding transcriptional regulator YafY